LITISSVKQHGLETPPKTCVSGLSAPTKAADAMNLVGEKCLFKNLGGNFSPPRNPALVWGNQLPANLACCAVSAYVHARRHVRFPYQI
ncbi:hypothetical protein, partial [Pseudorhizobium halotolerans]|uniref:hypothetical protein n=1 Tax=Pseudorhizobium halotolerans TaxID=1233081 RepID=UPI001B7D3897